MMFFFWFFARGDGDDLGSLFFFLFYRHSKVDVDFDH